MSKVNSYLKSVLQPSGSLPVVPIGFQRTGVHGISYMSKVFVDNCIDELDKLLLRAQLGEFNSLEQLGLMLLVESAYCEDLGELFRNAEKFSNRKQDKE